MCAVATMSASAPPPFLNSEGMKRILASGKAGWFDTDIINAFINGLIQHCPYYNENLMRLVLLDGFQSHSKRGLRDHIPNPVVLVAPINIRENHWVVVIVDTVKKMVFCLDSLDGKGNLKATREQFHRTVMTRMPWSADTGLCSIDLEQMISLVRRVVFTLASFLPSFFPSLPPSHVHGLECLLMDQKLTAFPALDPTGQSERLRSLGLSEHPSLRLAALRLG